MNEVKIRQSKYVLLAEQARLTGVSMEEIVDRALTSYIEYEQYIERLKTKIAAGK